MLTGHVHCHPISPEHSAAPEHADGAMFDCCRLAVTYRIRTRLLPLRDAVEGLAGATRLHCSSTGEGKALRAWRNTKLQTNQRHAAAFSSEVINGFNSGAHSTADFDQNW